MPAPEAPDSGAIEGKIYTATAAALAAEPWEVELFKQIALALESEKIQDTMYDEVLQALKDEFGAMAAEYPGCEAYFQEGNEAFARVVAHVARALIIDKTSSKLAKAIATEAFVAVKSATDSRLARCIAKGVAPAIAEAISAAMPAETP